MKSDKQYSDEFIPALTDEDLDAWIDAFRISFELENPKVRDRIDAIDGQNDEFNQILCDAIYAEADRRANIKTNALVAHTIEQGEAAIADGRLNDVTFQRDRNRLLAIRCARIVKLVGANAPQAVIDLAEKLLGRIRENKT